MCKSEQYFHLSESELFDEHMLYDLLDFPCVILTLSIISTSKSILNQYAKSLGGFKLSESFLSNKKMLSENNNNNNIDNSSGIKQQQSQLARSQSDTNGSKFIFQDLNQISNDSGLSNGYQNEHADDIYYNIVPNEINDSNSSSSLINENSNNETNNLVDGAESYYTDESFLFNGLQISSSSSSNKANGSQEDTMGNSAYQIIVTNANNSSSISQHGPTKRDFVMKEIIETEQNFVTGLTTLMVDFLEPLSTVLNDEDKRIICLNLKDLIKLHQNLYDNLIAACKGK